jgi:hypothetical protein
MFSSFWRARSKGFSYEELSINFSVSAAPGDAEELHASTSFFVFLTIDESLYLAFFFNNCGSFFIWLIMVSLTLISFGN